MIKDVETLLKDDNGNAIQIGSTFVTTNGTDVSPFTCTGNIDEIVIPDNAVEFIVYPDGSYLAVSEEPTLTGWDKVASGSKESFPCARMDKIYIQGTLGLKVYFRFTTI